MDTEQLIEKFENLSFEGDDFHHIEHLRIAWHYICSEPLEVAKQKFHGGVQALVTKLGAEDKYHRSLTDFFLDYLFQLRLYLGSDDWHKVEEQCPLIINDAKKLLGFYYSDKVIWSEQARLSYVEPDKAALDRASFKLTEKAPQVFELEEYQSPIIVSIPHNGQFIPHSVLKTMLPAALSSLDTDWYLSQLYDFLSEQKITCLRANYSRYLIDLNRDSSGVALYKNSDNTELCPTSTFDLQALYGDGNEPDSEEIKYRLDNYWKPYHQQLESLIEKAKRDFGYAIVFEAHSIAQEVPRFFDGKLPDFNFGTNEGKTVNQTLANFLEEFDTASYSKVINGRFKGGFITRHYAKPEENVFTIQLELSQATYMDERKHILSQGKLEAVKSVLESLISGLCQIDSLVD